MSETISNSNGLDYGNDILHSNGNSYKIRRSYIICNEGKLEEITVLCDFITGSDLLDMMSLMEKFGLSLAYIKANEMLFREIPPSLFVTGKYSGVLSEYKGRKVEQ